MLRRKFKKIKMIPLKNIKFLDFEVKKCLHLKEDTKKDTQKV